MKFGRFTFVGFMQKKGCFRKFVLAKMGFDKSIRRSPPGSGWPSLFIFNATLARPSSIYDVSVCDADAIIGFLGICLVKVSEDRL